MYDESAMNSILERNNSVFSVSILLKNSESERLNSKLGDTYLMESIVTYFAKLIESYLVESMANTCNFDESDTFCATHRVCAVRNIIDVKQMSNMIFLCSIDIEITNVGNFLIKKCTFAYNFITD